MHITWNLYITFLIKKIFCNIIYFQNFLTLNTIQKLTIKKKCYLCLINHVKISNLLMAIFRFTILIGLYKL